VEYSELEKKDSRLGNGLGDRNGLSWPQGYCKVVGEQEPIISARDKRILCELAKKVSEIASQPQQEEKKKLWMKHNALQETRPLIFIDPEYAWYELITADELQCSGNLARLWEFKLLKEIYWTEKIKDDRVIEPIFKVYYVHESSGRGLDTKIIGGEGSGGYTWDAPVKDYSDIDKMHFDKIIVDYDKTQKLVELANEVFNGILEVRLEGTWWWSLGMTTDLIYLRGFEQVMYDMYDNPDGLHSLMAFLRDETLAKLDFLEKNGLLSLNNGGDFIGTGGYGWSYELPLSDFDGTNVRLRDMWGYSESQETINISPESFEEFVFVYQLPILERFGLNIYGCCEPLDKRLDIVKRIPRLRRLSVSPWSDAVAMAEIIGKDYIYSRKVNPADIAVQVIDEDYIRKELRGTLNAVYKYGCRAEFLMRDIRTLAHNPYNAIRWTQIAREEIEKI
jgi:hypothetical protein